MYYVNNLTLVVLNAKTSRNIFVVGRVKKQKTKNNYINYLFDNNIIIMRVRDEILFTLIFSNLLVAD